MDAQIGSSASIPGSYPTWDFSTIANGTGVIVPIIYDQSEVSQQSSVAAFTQKGLIPQAPTIGVDWISYLTGNGSYSEYNLDADIRVALNNVGAQYIPQYSVLNGNLSVRIVQAATIIPNNGQV
jgi:hypothetical protein